MIREEVKKIALMGPIKKDFETYLKKQYIRTVIKVDLKAKILSDDSPNKKVIAENNVRRHRVSVSKGLNTKKSNKEKQKK